MLWGPSTDLLNLSNLNMWVHPRHWIEIQAIKHKHINCIYLLPFFLSSLLKSHHKNRNSFRYVLTFTFNLSSIEFMNCLWYWRDCSCQPTKKNYARIVYVIFLKLTIRRFISNEKWLKNEQKLVCQTWSRCQSKLKWNGFKAPVNMWLWFKIFPITRACVSCRRRRSRTNVFFFVFLSIGNEWGYEVHLMNCSDDGWAV